MEEANTQGADERVLLETPDGGRAAVPLSVLEQHRVPEERRAEVLGSLDDTAGFGAGAQDLSPDAPLYALDRDTLAQFRIADEGEGDVQGFASKEVHLRVAGGYIAMAKMFSAVGMSGESMYYSGKASANLDAAK